MAPAPATLEASYARCRELARRHGRTYYVSTFALPAVKRHHVWALYAFCRLADDIVDDLGDAPVAERRAALQALGDRLQCDVAAGRSDDPVLRAVVHTIRAFDIDADCFRRFLHSMAMDFEVCSYRTWDDLLGYMDGSAAVIGEMMLPILEPLRDDAREPARALGLAFQLTNFLRDVGEDLQRGRVYLPTDDLERFGADPWRRVVDDAWRQLMAFEIERCRAIYVAADAGLEALPPASARCVATARTLYSGILDEIERADYDVFTQRVRVPGRRKAWVAARAAVASRRGR